MNPNFLEDWNLNRQSGEQKMESAEGKRKNDRNKKLPIIVFLKLKE